MEFRLIPVKRKKEDDEEIKKQYLCSDGVERTSSEIIEARIRGNKITIE